MYIHSQRRLNQKKKKHTHDFSLKPFNTYPEVIMPQLAKLRQEFIKDMLTDLNCIQHNFLSRGHLNKDLKARDQGLHRLFHD